MLRKARCFENRRQDVNTAQEALERFKSICAQELVPLEPTATREQAYIQAFAALLDARQTVKGGIIRDILGMYEEDIQDIDILIPENTIDTMFEARQAVITAAMAKVNLRLVNVRWQGLKCLEMFYTWRANEDEEENLELVQTSPDLVCVQLSKSGDFANKKPDFSVCQFTVR
jgi:hypothetical protein